MQLFRNNIITAVFSALIFCMPSVSQAANQSYTFDTNDELEGTFFYDSDTGVFSNPNIVLKKHSLGAPSIDTNGTLPRIIFSSAPVNYYLSNPAFAPDFSVGQFDFSLYDFTQSFGALESGTVSFALSPSVAAVPEPETYAMLLAGLGLLGLAKRRQQS